MKSLACTVLIADDDRYVRDDLALLLQSDRYRLVMAETAEETRRRVAEEEPDLVLLDIKFPDCQDLSVLKHIRKEHPGTEVIVLTSQAGNVPRIVEAIKLGAYDYVTKPFSPEELRNRVEKALDLRRLRTSQDRLLKELRAQNGFDSMIGESPAIRRVRETIEKLAGMDSCVLIQGESGTGKELVARALHYRGDRAGEPFVVLNCAAIPDSLVESILFGHRRGAFTGAIESAEGSIQAAGRGTIFLDEIADMPLSQQASLLRVLEYRRYCRVGENAERECHARFVLASNQDLAACVKEGRFREDLYYRVKIAAIAVPPLRSRPEDIRILGDCFCKRLCAQMGRPPVAVSDEAFGLLLRYDWPGNVRELKNTIEAAIMLADRTQETIGVRDLPPELLAVRTDGDPDSRDLSARERHEKEDLIRALRDCNGVQTDAARVLGCHRNTVRTRIRYYGLSDLRGGNPRASGAT